jgi:hypothetical protein
VQQRATNQGGLDDYQGKTGREGKKDTATKTITEVMMLSSIPWVRVRFRIRVWVRVRFRFRIRVLVRVRFRFRIKVRVGAMVRVIK